MKRILEFDGIRTFAVLIVIADHYAPFRNFANGAPAKLGGLGVDVFFVLSGYLITRILLDLKTADQPYQVFYARRFLRILPPFILLLMLVYGVGVLLHEPVEKLKLLGQVLFLRSFKGTGGVVERLWDVFRGAAAIPGLFHKLVSAPIPRDYPRLPMSGSLGPTWSLSVEEWFYLLWAPVVLVFRRRIILTLAVLVCVMGFLLRWIGGGGTDFLSSVDILITGAALALWVERRRDLSTKVRLHFDSAIALLAWLSFILFVALTWMHRDLVSRTLIEIFTFGAIAWTIAHAGHHHPICSVLRFRPIVYVGTVSYTVYLIHLPIYFVVRSALQGATAALPELAQMWLVSICSLIATIAFAALSWKYYERPILGFKDALTERIRRRKAPTSQVRSTGSFEHLEGGSVPENCEPILYDKATYAANG
jgi:peptidoglycan/LPS O-acetylase OafA/YrhL